MNAIVSAEADAGAAASAASLGRFRLLRELGRGAQARVMLAHDPRLDREVALKLLNPAADADALEDWLNEARAVSRLAHPNIVPVFEADAHAGQPYMVFEFVDGPTLAQARRGKGAMPAREAAALLLDVLDALAAAHGQQLVHRDLKPSNVLLGCDGRPRVMDFGIAARVDTADGRIVGTAGYMSPEAARGEAPLPAMDVFAAGMMLGELLSGAPLLRESDPHRAVYRIQHEDMQLPPGTRVDEALRSIVQRAVARQRAERFDSARAMHTALSAWLEPPVAAGAAGPEADSPATLEFLLRRMRHKTDFPALSASIVRIQRMATSETESLTRLTAEILKDVALTNKLLRMVNTANFSAVAGEGVGTVSRAVALVGFAGIRNMALSVVLLEHMGDKAHATQLKEEFLRALMAGTLAEALSPPSALSRDGEEVFLGALFQNLGRLLTECYLPEEAVQIRQQLKTGDACEREAAAHRVLGLTYDQLGAGVARAWGLPSRLRHALRRPEGAVPSKAVDSKAERGAESGAERLRWLGRSAGALADALLGSDGTAQAQALQAAAELHAPVLDASPRDVVLAVHSARTRLAQLAQAMGVTLAPGAPARRLLEATQSTLLLNQPADIARTGHRQLRDTLDSVRKETASTSVPPGDILARVLQAMHTALAFRRVVFCLREGAAGPLVGRIALGEGAAALRTAFRFVPDSNATDNLFAWLSAKGADLLVSDSSAVVARLPAWYRQRIAAPTFLLMPVMLKGAPLGMIYADKMEAGAIVLGNDDMALLRALRDEVAAAFSALSR